MKGSRATDYVNTVLWYVLLTLLQSAPAFATTTVTLSNAFIDEMRDRAIFDAVLLIDYAHDKAKPPAEDGDIHIAGWSPTVDLTTVAEIANAKKEKPAITRANEAEGRIRDTVREQLAARSISEMQRKTSARACARVFPRSFGSVPALAARPRIPIATRLRPADGLPTPDDDCTSLLGGDGGTVSSEHLRSSSP